MSGRAKHLTERTTLVLDVIRAARVPITAFEVAAMMREHPSTIRHLINHLAEIGAIVVEATKPPARGGRPAAHYVVRDWQPRSAFHAPRAEFTPRPDIASAWLFGGRNAA